MILKVTVAGDEGQRERRGYVILANHVGYIDGIVLGSIVPIVFVSNKEVRSWPSVGQRNILCGTIFIERQHKGLVGRMVQELSRKLKQEANIRLFPEGASTNGEQLLLFQTVLLAAPLRSRSVMVPTTIAYKSIDDAPISPANRDSLYGMATRISCRTSGSG